MNNEQAEFYIRAGRAVIFPNEADEHCDWMAKKAEEAAEAATKAQKGSFITMIYEAEATRLSNGIIAVRRATDAIAHQDGTDATIRSKADSSSEPSDRPGGTVEHGCDSMEEAGERPGIRNTIERVRRDTAEWLQDARQEHPGW